MVESSAYSGGAEGWKEMKCVPIASKAGANNESLGILGFREHQKIHSDFHKLFRNTSLLQHGQDHPFVIQLDLPKQEASPGFLMPHSDTFF